MTRRTPFYRSLTLGVLALAACGDNTTPSEPGTVGDRSLAVSSLAVASNTWTAKAPQPGTGLFGASAGVVPNSAGQSIVYVFGGTDGAGGTGFGTRAYDVATNTWTNKGASSRVFVFNSNGVGKVGNKLYFSGGYDYGSGERLIATQVWAYDPGANRLIRKADMPKATADGVTGVIDGKLYVLPGTCSGDLWPDPRYCEQEPIRRLFRYDPVTNSWTGLRYAPHFHKNGAGGVINGKFYVAGGFNGFQPVADLDVYDPARNIWRTLAPVPTAGAAIGTVLQGKLFVIVQSGSELRAYAYDPASNTWKAKAVPARAHDSIARVTLDGRTYLLAVGGSHGRDSEIPNDSELYTP
jgi:N-acetylneuraminic acid mutarotase